MEDLDLRLLAASTLYQSENMDRAPDRSTLRRVAADACDKLEKPHAASAMKEVCRRVTEMSVAERRRASTDASGYSLPDWLYDKLSRDVDANAWLEEYGHLLLERPNFLNVCVPPKAVFGGRSEYCKLLKSELKLDAKPSDLAPHGVLIRSRPRDVLALPGIATNAVHVQDAVMQYACSVLKPLREGARVLDACASPGGKSRAILHHHPHAHVVAVDVNERKVKAMRKALLSGTSAMVRQLTIAHGDVTDVSDDGSSSWWDGEKFSAILVDPPCTATGLLRTIPEVKAHRNADDVKALRRTQLHMLKSAWALLEEGGQLLYTTCSILKEENDVVIDTFLKRIGGASVVRVKLPPAPTGPAGQRVTMRRRKHGVVFYPSETHQGGYVALIENSRSERAD